MDDYKGKTLSWRLADGVVEIALDRPPANEIGLAMLEDLERFVSALPALESKASALILHSEQKAGFSAGADLRELYEQAEKMNASSAAKGVREFLERIHAVLNRLDTSVQRISQFTADASHELRAPVSLIRSGRLRVSPFTVTRTARLAPPGAPGGT